nr:reverse transcriptase domain-containing protein [Tanacetum cinerariifolium]
TAKVNVATNDDERRIDLDLLEERREHATIYEAKAKSKMKGYYDAKVRGVSFRPGDFVYRANGASHAEDAGKRSCGHGSPFFPLSMSRSHEANELIKLRSSLLISGFARRIFSLRVKTLKCDQNFDSEIQDEIISIFDAPFFTGSVCLKLPSKRTYLPPNKECGSVRISLRLMLSASKQCLSFMGASSQMIKSVLDNNFPR